MHRFIPFVLIALSSASSTGCNRTQPVPTSPTTTPAATPAPDPGAGSPVVSLKLSAPDALSQVGETAQFTLAGTRADGSTVDVTTQARWESSHGNALRISSAGLLTVVGLGLTRIKAIHGETVASQLIAATPAGTFAVEGRVREPGKSAMPSVTVVEPESGQTVVTDAQGNFTIGGLSPNQRLRVAPAGYEPVEVELPRTVPANRIGGSYDVALQRTVRVAAGDSAGPVSIAAHDVAYTMADGPCSPCRMIRVSVPAAGTLHLSLSWSETPESVYMWVDGIRRGTRGPSGALEADVAVPAGETLVYAGLNTGPTLYEYAPYIWFTLSTGFTPVTRPSR